MPEPTHCPRCASGDVQTLPHSSARCRACLHTFRTDGWNAAPDTADTRPVAECPRCGTLTIRETPTAAPCAVCADTTRANQQGTALEPAERLFEPAPAPMPGQIMGRWDPYQ